MTSQNAYVSGKQKCIPAVLIYAFYKNQVLLLHRTRDPKLDFHSGKWNGLGGKIELGETPREAALREFFEESGISLMEQHLVSQGGIFFPNFKPTANEDWMVFLFTAQLTDGQYLLFKSSSQKSEEGFLQWVDRDQVLSLPLWPADKEFLPAVLDGKIVTGSICYKENAYMADLNFSPLISPASHKV